MKKSIVQSERQRPRAVQLMKAIYSSHTADPTCKLGQHCPMMIDLKKRIDEEERLQSGGETFLAH